MTAPPPSPSKHGQGGQQVIDSNCSCSCSFTQLLDEYSNPFIVPVHLGRSASSRRLQGSEPNKQHSAFAIIGVAVSKPACRANQINSQIAWVACSRRSTDSQLLYSSIFVHQRPEFVHAQISSVTTPQARVKSRQRFNLLGIDGTAAEPLQAWPGRTASN